MINIRGVSLVYNQNKQNEFCALKNIDLDINDGELVILKGISGSGKSTLLSLIALLQKPTSGEILIDGTNIAKLPDAFCSELRHKRLGLVFQNFNLIEGLSVYENLLAPFALTNFKANVRDEMIKKALSLANITHKKDANIILADEPTANLDRQNTRAFLGLLESFKALKKSVIVATHDSIFDELSATDRVVSLQNGEIV